MDHTTKVAAPGVKIKFSPPELKEYGRLSEIILQNDGVPPTYPSGWFDDNHNLIRIPVCEGGAGPGKPDANPDAWNQCGSSS